MALALGIGPWVRWSPAAETFRDVPQGHWAFEEVHWLRADGLIEGWGGKLEENTFHGEDTFSRYEMAKVLARYMKRYYAERDQVRGRLASLGAEGRRQDAELEELTDRTRALETKVGTRVRTATKAASPTPEVPAAMSTPAPTPERRAAAAPAPRVFRVEAESGALDESMARAEALSGGAGEDPASVRTARIAELRARYAALRTATPSPAQVEEPPPVAEPPAPTPTRPAVVELRDPDPDPRTGTGSGPGDEERRVPQAGSISTASARDLSPEEAERLDAIRDRYRRLMDARRPATPTPPSPAVTRAPTRPAARPAPEPVATPEPAPVLKPVGELPAPGDGFSDAVEEFLAEEFPAPGLGHEDEDPEGG